MTKLFQKKRILVLFFLFIASSLTIPAAAETFFGTVPTGLMELQDYKYPVFLYVPANYQPTKNYPMIFSIPAEGESPEKNIEFWLSLAKRKSVIVVSPTNLRPEDVPYAMDKWLLQIKDDITKRYRVAPLKTYLVGKDGGAHYAAYLGTSYPNEFSAVAALGGSWIGKYAKLIRLQGKPRRQVPFFVALRDDQGDLIEATKSRAFEFEKKGYPIYFVKLEGDETFEAESFKKEIMKWLEEKSLKWREIVEESNKKPKERMLITLEEFFKI